MKKMRRIGTALTSLVLAALLAMGMAAGIARADGSASLRVEYAYEGTAIANAEFRLYHVASGTAASGFALTAAFAGYPVQTAGLDQQGWQELALTLAGYAQRDGLAEKASGATDGNGVLALSAALEPGLYLLLGGKTEQGAYVYEAAPAIVAVQGAGETVKPKSTRKDAEETVTRRVLKVWKDEGFEAERPAQVEVELLRDGVPVSTAKLTATNSWRFSWEKLNAKYTWAVVEKNVPAGYSVKAEQQGVTYTITNAAEPCMIDPPVKKIITGDAPAVQAAFRFVMEAVSNTAGYSLAEMPMPEGSANGKKTHDQTGAGEFEFGNIYYMRPGTYVYRLYEDGATKSAGYTYDETEYTITAVVTEANGKLIAETTAQKKGEAEAKRVPLLGPSAYVFEFTNDYRTTTTPPTTLPPATQPPSGGDPTKPPQLPQTGQLWWPVPVLALAGLAFVVIGLVRRKREAR